MREEDNLGHRLMVTVPLPPQNNVIKTRMGENQFSPHSPACPGGSFLAVSQHHLIVVGEVLLNEVEGTDTEGLRDQAWLEGGSPVEGHEESQGPHVIGLIVLLSFLAKQVILMSRADDS